MHNPYLILSTIRCIAVEKLYHSFPSQCKLEDTNLKTMNILETEKRLTRPQSSSCNDEVVSEDSCPVHFRMVEASLFPCARLQGTYLFFFKT